MKSGKDENHCTEKVLCLFRLVMLINMNVIILWVWSEML